VLGVPFIIYCLKMENDMKIAIFQLDVFPQSTFSKNLYRFVNEGVRRGWEIDVLLIDKSEWRKPDGVRLFEMSKPSKKKIVPPHYRSILKLSEYLKLHRPSAIIAKGPTLGIATALAIALSRTSVKLYISLHSPISINKRFSVYRSGPVIPHLLRLLSKYVEQFVCVSQSVRDDFISETGISPKKFSVINHAILDVDENVAPGGTLRWRPRQDGLQVAGALQLLFVGRLAPEKGVHILIDAVNLLKFDIAVKCRIVGDGPIRAQLEDRVSRLGLNDEVLFVGRLAQVDEMYDWADVVVLPSFFEGLPSVIIEAFGRGCPVVAADGIGGVNELLEGGRLGTLVPVGDPEQLAEGIRTELQRRRDPATLIDRARHFSSRSTLNRWADLFE